MGISVQAKKPRKSYKNAEARDLAPLELIYSDLCEMNGVLKKCKNFTINALIERNVMYQLEMELTPCLYNATIPGHGSGRALGRA